MALYESNYDEHGVDLNAPPKPIVPEPPRTVYNYDKDGELTDTGKTQFANGVHVMAANATMVKPLADKTDNAQLFDESTQKWGYVTDHRGKEVYDKVTKQASTVDYLGDIKDTHTKDKPPSERHKYVGDHWVYSDSDKKRYLERDLMNAVDEAHSEALHLALGYRATPLQLERYRDKYTRAKAGEFTEEVNDKIIANHERYIRAMKTPIDLLEAYRGVVSDLLDKSELGKAEHAILDLTNKSNGLDVGAGLDEARFKNAINALLPIPFGV